MIQQNNERQRTEAVPSSVCYLWTPHRHRDLRGGQLESLTRQLGSCPELRELRPCGEIRRQQCLDRNACANVFTQSSSVPFPERLKLQYPDEWILSGYEEDATSTRDRCTTWVKADPNDTLERRVVGVRKAFTEFREASASRQDTSAQ